MTLGKTARARRLPPRAARSLFYHLDHHKTTTTTADILIPLPTNQETVLFV